MGRISRFGLLIAGLSLAIAVVVGAPRESRAAATVVPAVVSTGPPAGLG